MFFNIFPRIALLRHELELAHTHKEGGGGMPSCADCVSCILITFSITHCSGLREYNLKKAFSPLSDSGLAGALEVERGWERAS
jgi:hypothetical protein